MRPIYFKEANKMLIRPEDMTDDECCELHVYRVDEEVISCWRPNWTERLSILFFGKVWLSVLSGDTQPPVAVWAYKRLFQEASDER